MDHADAIRAQSVERYLLGELNGAAREEFEEHFFSCALCAEEVRSGADWVDNAAAELRTAPVFVPERRESWRRWFGMDWRWQTAFAVPVVALAAVSGLWVHDHGRLATELAAATQPQALIAIPLEVTRGERVTMHRDARAVAVSFFVEPDTLPSYAIEISGNGVAPASVIAPAPGPGKRFNILLPSARYKPGHYEISVKGGPGTDGRSLDHFSLNLE